jgi:hypothetical protein
VEAAPGDHGAIVGAVLGSHDAGCEAMTPHHVGVDLVQPLPHHILTGGVLHSLHLQIVRVQGPVLISYEFAVLY